MSDIIRQEFKKVINSFYGRNPDIETDFTKSIKFLLSKLDVKFITYEFVEKIKDKYGIVYTDLYNFSLVKTKVRNYEINNILNKI